MIRLALALLLAGADDKADKKRAVDDLKRIGIALHGYQQAEGTLPPQAVHDKDGKALLSWRVLILPHLGEGKLFKEFKLDEPWDSDHNKKLLARMPKVFAPAIGKAGSGTAYKVVHAKGAAFDGKRGVPFKDIADGLSNTLLVVEGGPAVPWTKPEDLTWFKGGPLPKLGGVFKDGYHLMTCDGWVMFRKEALKPETLERLILRADGKPLGPDF